MDISFYVLLTLACMVLLLAMWFCAASNTNKWGPDLTLELPPHILQEALFGHMNKVTIKEFRSGPIPMPSAPSELPYAPLLTNEQPMDLSKPPLKTFSPCAPVLITEKPVQMCKPPAKTFNPSVMLNMDSVVRVLPPRFEFQHKVKPVYYKFTTDEPA